MFVLNDVRNHGRAGRARGGQAGRCRPRGDDDRPPIATSSRPRVTRRSATGRFRSAASRCRAAGGSSDLRPDAWRLRRWDLPAAPRGVKGLPAARASCRSDWSSACWPCRGPASGCRSAWPAGRSAASAPVRLGRRLAHPVAVGTLGWAREAAAAAPAADVYHGHDLTGLPAAIRAAKLHGGLVVYDSHEYFVESGTNARRPGWAKRIMRRQEAAGDQRRPRSSRSTVRWPTCSGRRSASDGSPSSTTPHRAGSPPPPSSPTCPGGRAHPR